MNDENKSRFDADPLPDFSPTSHLQTKNTIFAEVSVGIEK